MRTSKLISTISYNSKEFLDHHLKQLYADHKISDYIYIYHYAEDDELKNHFHVVIKPNCLFDTMDLQDYFKEYDPNNPLNPLGMTDFKVSKMDDWILYDLHYPPYLAWKGQSRKYQYDPEEMICADKMTFQENYLHAMKESEFAYQYNLLKDLQRDNIAPVDLINNGRVPLVMASQLRSYMLMAGKETYRNGKKGHE